MVIAALLQHDHAFSCPREFACYDPTASSRTDDHNICLYCAILGDCQWYDRRRQGLVRWLWWSIAQHGPVGIDTLFIERRKINQASETLHSLKALAKWSYRAICQSKQILFTLCLRESDERAGAP